MQILLVGCWLDIKNVNNRKFSSTGGEDIPEFILGKLWVQGAMEYKNPGIIYERKASWRRMTGKKKFQRDEDFSRSEFKVEKICRFQLPLNARVFFAPNSLSTDSVSFSPFLSIRLGSCRGG